MALPRLLLVENDPYYIYLLRMYAEQSGFAVVVASSGMGVEALAQREKPVVIVLESDLPEVSGWEVLSRLRSEPCTQTTPVVICLWQDSERGYEVHSTEFVLHKPMEFDDFVYALSTLGVLSGDNLGRPHYPAPADA